MRFTMTQLPFSGLLLAGAAALALGACATTPAATTAVAATAAETGGNGAAGGHEKDIFVETYDADGDGVVTQAEFDAERLEGFTARDANGDGIIHREEYVAEYEVRLDADLAATRAAQLEQADNRFDALDDDEDGDMTAAEFNDSGAWMFGELDTNKDGVVNDQDTAEAY